MVSQDKAAFAKSSKTGEHYTPKYIMKAVYKTFTVDLDPASDPYERVRAKEHFTKDDNGLDKPWKGAVFLNPPYGYGVIAWFIKLLKDYLSGEVTEAIVVWKSATETDSWAILTHIAERVCYPDHRISFDGPPGEARNNTATYSSTLFYIGKNPERFEENFSHLGQVWPVPESVKNRKETLELVKKVLGVETVPHNNGEISGTGLATG